MNPTSELRIWAYFSYFSTVFLYFGRSGRSKSVPPPPRSKREAAWQNTKRIPMKSVTCPNSVKTVCVGGGGLGGRVGRVSAERPTGTGWGGEDWSKSNCAPSSIWSTPSLPPTYGGADGSKLIKWGSADRPGIGGSAWETTLNKIS